MGRGLTAAKAAWAGAAAVLAAALLWACIGPDSLLQNLLLDKLRARYAHGRLTAVSDQEPLGRRCPVLLVLGANTSEDPDGPGAGRARLYAGDLWRSLGAAYRARAGRELGADAKLYSFWYNSSADDCEIARSLNWLIEADPDLTRAHVKIAAGGHSKGALRRVVALGDGWHASGKSPAELRDGIAQLRQLADAAAVHVDEVGGGRGEKHHGAGQVGRLAPAARRNARGDLLVSHGVVEERLRVVRAHVARRDRVDVDAAAGPLVCERLGELRDAALARRVAGPADEPDRALRPRPALPRRPPPPGVGRPGWLRATTCSKFAPPLSSLPAGSLSCWPTNCPGPITWTSGCRLREVESLFLMPGVNSSTRRVLATSSRMSARAGCPTGLRS